MVIKPKVRGYVCITAHPAGCEANVREQIECVRRRGPFEGAPRRVLVIGASTGYGLASRITTAFGCGAASVGVFLEREPTATRPATAGWYNSAAFSKLAKEAGISAFALNGDAFSHEVKERTIELVRNEVGPLDLVIYSLAAPVRTHPATGEMHRSTIKPIGAAYRGKTLDTDRAEIREVEIEPANEREIRETVSVMGGEDWEWWVQKLEDADLIAEGCRTIAFTYIGPALTQPIYRNGTIGRAKEDLERAARAIGERLATHGGSARIAVMKAVVTQASSAIPVVPLYISLLFRVMKEKGIHEGCIEQAYRLFSTRFYGPDATPLDDAGRIRMDDLEMRADVQSEIDRRWPRINTDNLRELTDFDGYQAEFLRLFGFGIRGVDYEADVDPIVPLEP